MSFYKSVDNNTSSRSLGFKKLALIKEKTIAISLLRDTITPT